MKGLYLAWLIISKLFKLYKGYIFRNIRIGPELTLFFSVQYMFLYWVNSRQWFIGGNCCFSGILSAHLLLTIGACGLELSKHTHRHIDTHKHVHASSAHKHGCKQIHIASTHIHLNAQTQRGGQTQRCTHICHLWKCANTHGCTHTYTHTMDNRLHLILLLHILC